MKHVFLHYDFDIMFIIILYTTLKLHITRANTGNWPDSTISVGDVMRCYVISKNMTGDIMSTAKQMQRMFMSVECLASRARVMKAEQVRVKIKTEFDKYIGRGRRTRTKYDHEQLNKCKFI